MTHVPTGLSADSHHERSQHKNGVLAMRILAGRLWAFAANPGKPDNDRIRPTTDGSAPKQFARQYVLAPYQSVHDPRTGARTAQVDAVLDGDLRVFLSASAHRG